MLAKQIPTAFVALQKDNQTVSGRAGHFLVQTKDGSFEQYAVDPKQFTDQYELVNKGKNAGNENERVEYVDFNLAAYFSIIMGRLLGEIVNIELLTWVAVETVLVLFYALSIFATKFVFCIVIIASGFALAILLSLLLNKLRTIQRQLMDRTLWLKADLTIQQ